MRYIRNNMPLAEKQMLEVAQMKISEQTFEQEKQNAKLDYIAMMADIDLNEALLDEEEKNAE